MVDAPIYVCMIPVQLGVGGVAPPLHWGPPRGASFCSLRSSWDSSITMSCGAGEVDGRGNLPVMNVPATADWRGKSWQLWSSLPNQNGAGAAQWRVGPLVGGPRGLRTLIAEKTVFHPAGRRPSSPPDLLQQLHLVDLVHRQLLAVLDLVQQWLMGLPVQEDPQEVTRQVVCFNQTRGGSQCPDVSARGKYERQMSVQGKQRLD